MRRGSVIMLVCAVAMVAAAFTLQRVDVVAGQARYWQHEQQPSEEDLARDPATSSESASSAKSKTGLVTHLPIVRVQTNGQKIPGKSLVDAMGRTTGHETSDAGEEEIPVTFSTVEQEGVWHHANDDASVEGTASFRIRGNSSRRFSKSNYLLRITDSYGSDENGKLGLLGMEPGTKWSLHGPFLDKTLMRNYLCMNLCGEVMDQWVPETRFCELIMDGEYKGVYVLMEMIEVQDKRLNLSEYDEGDVACSYFMRIENERNTVKTIETFDSYTYRLESGREILLEYPKVSKQTDEVRNYASANASAVERMLYAHDIEGWMDELDVQSFVDYYLLEEFMAINDAFSASTYFYRDVRGKFTMGPVWDFNNSFNNFFNELPTRAFILSQRAWFAELMRSEDFVERVITRWRTLRQGVLSDDALRSRVYSIESWLGSAIDRNYEVWGYSFDTSKLTKDEMRQPDVGSDQTVEDLNPSSYDEAMEWMVDYMLNRARWMDENIYTLRQYCHESRNL